MTTVVQIQSLPTFKGEGDVQHFLDEMEYVAEIGQWTEDQWIIRVAGSLKGKATPVKKYIRYEIAAEEQISRESVEAMLFRLFHPAGIITSHMIAAIGQSKG